MPPRILPRAAGSVDQFVAHQRQRIFQFQRLDRQVGGVGHMHVHAIQPILVPARAGAAADRFEIDPECPVGRLRAGEGDGEAGAVRRRRHLVRHGLRQCAEDQVDDTLAQRQSSVHRRRVDAVHDAALGRRHGQRTGEAGIRQDRRIDDRFDRVIDGGQRRGHRHVQPGAHLRRCIEMQAASNRRLTVIAHDRSNSPSISGQSYLSAKR